MGTGLEEAALEAQVVIAAAPLLQLLAQMLMMVVVIRVDYCCCTASTLSTQLLIRLGVLKLGRVQRIKRST